MPRYRNLTSKQFSVRSVKGSSSRSTGVGATSKDMTTFKRLLRRFTDIIGFSGPRDRRSRRIVVVIECILNQNARDNGAAVSPSINRPVVNLCQKYEVGILQVPCPEIDTLGFNRSRPPGVSLREAMATDEAHKHCRKISIGVADRLQDYSRQGFKILAVVGGNPESPGCAVHMEEKGLSEDSGTLMRELYDELEKRNLTVPFRGMCDSNLDLLAEDLRWLERVFSNGCG